MRLSVTIIMCLFASSAWAHKPYFSTGEYGSADQAWAIENHDVSIVLYHKVTCDEPVVWLRYEVDEPTEIFVQLGVPLIDRLESYNPVIGVVHDQVTDGVATPFPVPEGLGVQIHGSSGERELFFEPFTQTQSWILLERKVPVPAGSGYITAWDPNGETGKLWVAVGETEEFTQDDWANAPNWLGDARFFHEAGSGPAVEPQEQMCSAVAPDSCAAIQPSWGLGLLIALLGIRRRR